MVVAQTGQLRGMARCQHTVLIISCVSTGFLCLPGHLLGSYHGYSIVFIIHYQILFLRIVVDVLTLQRMHTQQLECKSGPSWTFSWGSPRVLGVAKRCHVCQASRRHLQGISPGMPWRAWQGPAWRTCHIHHGEEQDGGGEARSGDCELGFGGRCC